MITRRGTAALGLAIISLLLAVLYNHLALALLGTAALAWVLSAWLIVQRVRVTGEREAEVQWLPEGAVSNVTYRLTSRRGHQRLDAHQPLPQGVILNGEDRVKGVLSKDETVEQTFEVEFPIRGLYHLAPPEVRASDPFNLVERVIDVDTGPLTFTIVPSKARARDALGRPKHAFPRPGKFSSTKPGAGSDFYSIREYMPNDALRLVNWKASARQADLMVNQYEDERSTQMVALIDHRLTTGLGPFQDAPIHEVTRAAMLTHRMATEGADSFLAILVGREARTLKSDGTSAFKNRFQGRLAELTPEGACPLEHAVRESMHALKEGAKVIVCSPLLHEDDIEGIILLLARRCVVTVILPSVAPPTTPEEEKLVENHEENAQALEGLPVRAVKVPLGLIEHAIGPGVKI